MRLPFLLLFAFKLSLAGEPLKQDYMLYNTKITEVSLLIFRGDEHKALRKFDSLFNAFEYIFAKDAYMAAQLAGKLGNDTLGFKYLDYSISHGVPLSLIRRDSLIYQLSLVNPAKWQKMLKGYEQARDLYKARINTPCRRTIDSIYELDQALTRKLNASVVLRPYYWLAWNRRNKKDLRVVLSMISTCGYPGEKTAGISTLDFTDTTKTRYGVNCFIAFHKTEFILIHYFSKKRKSLDAALLPEVKKGNMTVYEYAVIHDFMARWGKKKHRSNYCNEWHQSPEALYNQVDSNRAALGLCPLQIKNEYETYWKSISKHKPGYQAVYLSALM